MPRPSTIKQLPEKIRAQVDFMLTEGGWTIDQVVDYLAEAGHPRSRSAVGRYKQNLDQVAAKLRESREVVDALVQELGPEAREGKHGRLLVEILRKLAFDSLLKQMDSDDPAMEPGDFFFLAKALREMSAATRLDQDFEEKLRSQVMKEAARKLETAEQEARRAGEKGLSAERLAQLRREFLGVRDAGDARG